MALPNNLYLKFIESNNGYYTFKIITKQNSPSLDLEATTTDGTVKKSTVDLSNVINYNLETLQISYNYNDEPIIDIPNTPNTKLLVLENSANIILPDIDTNTSIKFTLIIDRNNDTIDMITFPNNVKFLNISHENTNTEDSFYTVIDFVGFNNNDGNGTIWLATVNGSINIFR